MSQQSRNPKRARKKEGQQRRREAELAAMKRQRRTGQIKRAVIFGVLILGSLFLVQQLTGDDGDQTDVATESTTTTTSEPAPDAATTCDVEEGFDAALATKPEIDVPKEPATELETEDLVVGSGDVVPEGATIKARYVGVGQASGEEFDSSWSRGCDPIEFSLTGVIAGWTQGIPGMKVGGRRLLTIPGDLAYGDAGRAPSIAPNETLTFVVDVVSITPPAGGPTTTATP